MPIKSTHDRSAGALSWGQAREGWPEVYQHIKRDLDQGEEKQLDARSLLNKLGSKWYDIFPGPPPASNEVPWSLAGKDNLGSYYIPRVDQADVELAKLREANLEAHWLVAKNAAKTLPFNPFSRSDRMKMRDARAVVARAKQDYKDSTKVREDLTALAPNNRAAFEDKPPKEAVVEADKDKQVVGKSHHFNPIFNKSRLNRLQ